MDRIQKIGNMKNLQLNGLKLQIGKLALSLKRVVFEERLEEGKGQI